MLELLNQFIPNIMDKLPDFWTAILETFIMLGIVGVISLLIGTLFGVIMVVTKKEGILENAILYFLIGKVIDFFRAIPFIVLIFLIAPMTRAIVGTTSDCGGPCFHWQSVPSPLWPDRLKARYPKWITD